MRKNIYLFTFCCLLNVLHLGAQVTLTIPDNISVSCGDEVTVPVSVTGFTGLTGLTFSLSWDPTVFEYVPGSATSIITTNFSATDAELADGNIGFVWVDLANIAGTNLADGTIIGEISFTLIGSGSSSDINFGNTPVDITAFDQNVNILDEDELITNSGTIAITTPCPDASPLQIDCPSDQIVTAISNTASVAINNLIPTLSANADPSSLSYTLTMNGNTIGGGSNGDDASGTTFGVGTTLLTYTISDNSGTVSTSCTTTITVNGAPTDSNTFTLLAGNSTVTCADDMVCIDVTTSNFQSLSNIQFSINWDQSLLEFVSVENNDDALEEGLGVVYGQEEVQDGILIYTWSDVAGIGRDIDDGTRLFTLCYRAVADGTASIDFTSNPTNIEVFRFIDSSLEEEVTPSFISGTIAITGCNTGTGDGMGDGGNTGDGNGATNFTLNATNNTTTCSDNLVCIEVNADNFQSLSSLQFSVNWDQSLLEFVSVENNDVALDPVLGVLYGQELELTSNGILTFTWADIEGDGHTLNNGTRLFTLCFRPLAEGNSSISFTDNSTSIEVFQFVNTSEDRRIDDNLVLNPGNISITNCGTMPPVTGQNLNIIAGTNSATCTDQMVCINVLANNFTSLADLQFTVNWDPIIMEFVSVENNDAALDPTLGVLYGRERADLIANGNLTFTWADVEGDGHTLANGMRLFTLCFRPLSNGVGTISFTGNETPIEATRFINENTPEPIDPDFTTGSITVSGCTDVTNTNFTLFLSGLEVDCAAMDNICIDVLANNFTSLADIQFAVNWDQNNLQFVSVENNDGALDPTLGVVYGQGEVQDGLLNFTWSDVEGDGHTLTNGTRLFTLCYELIGPGSNEISFTDNNTLLIEVTEFINENTINPITGVSQFLPGTLSFLDTIPPTIGNCPTEPIIVFVEANNCQAVGNWEEPIFIDDCSFVDVEETFTPGTVFDLGDQLVQYTAIDASANIAECIFTVSVRDAIAPVVLNCPSSQSRELSAATGCDPIFTWDPPTVSDNCTDVNSIILSPTIQPGNAFSMGVTTVRYSILDSSGNLNNDCAFTIELTGEAPLRITDCPDNIPVSFSPQSGCDLSVPWTPPVLVDGCGIGNVSFDSNFDPGDQFPVGTTVVTYMASDEANNTASCSFEVTITGASGLNFPSCPSNITVDSQLDLCGGNVGWPIPSATGGCGVPTTVANFQPLDFFPVGTTTVAYTATDDAGQVSVCSFTITVVDAQSLIVRCPTNISVGADGSVLEDAGNFIRSIALEDCDDYRIEYGDIEAVDNCSATINRTIVQGLASNSLFNVGMNELEIQVSNDSGESRNCMIQIDIEERAPLVAGISANVVCEGQEVRLEAPTLPGTTYTWSGPSGFTSNAQNPIINSPTSLNSGDYTVTAFRPGGCVETSTIAVVVNPAATVEATSSGLECGGGQIALMATSQGMPIVEWEWRGPNSYSSDEQNPIINNAEAIQAGDYVVRGTTANGCVSSDVVEVVVSSIAPTVIAAGLLTPGVACVEQAIDLKGNVFPGDVTYTWTGSDPEAGVPADNNDSLIVVTPTAPGTFTYTYTVDLGGGCVADTSITIEIMPSPTILLESNGPFLCGTTDQRIELSATNVGENQNVAYSWVGPLGFEATAPSPFIADVTNRGGDYILTTTFITNGVPSGCMANDTINVAVTNRPEAPILLSERVIACEGDDLILEVMPDTALTYRWIGPNNFTSTDSVVVISNVLIENAGGYQVVASNNGCESDVATLSAAVLTDPELNDDLIDNMFNESMEFEVISNDTTLVSGAGFTIRLLDADPVSGLVENEAGSLESNGDGSFLFTPAQDWIGIVQVAYEICYEDCPELCSTAVVTIDTDVSSEECFIPGVLSPNGDDRNDALIISCNPDPGKEGGIFIFNQWGSKVFEAFPYNNDWTGLYEGEELPDGVYYYIYKQTDDDQDPVRGCVTIFR